MLSGWEGVASEVDGDRALAQGSPLIALEAYQKALESAQGSERVNILESKVLEAAVRAEAYQTALELAPSLEDPTQPESRYWTAMAFMGLGQIDRVIPILEDLNKRAKPDFPFASEVRLNLARLWTQNGQSKKAEAILSNTPDDEWVQAITLARSSERQREAKRRLQRFLDRNPEHSRALDAKLALAELGLTASPRSLALTVTYLEELKRHQLTRSDAERVAFLSVWLAGWQGSWGEVLGLSEAFLMQYTDSPHAAEVEFQRARAHFEQREYDGSLQRLASVFGMGLQPDDTVLLRGRFLEAKAVAGAGRPDEALKLWARIFDITEGETLLEARYEQALLLCQMNQREDALAQLDQILASEPPTELEFRALMTKGECQAVLAGKEILLISEAEATFDKLIQHQLATSAWKEQALYRKGVLYRQAGDSNKAMKAFYEVMYPGGNPVSGPLNEPASAWYYRAGFEAIDYLSSRGEEVSWLAAARLADQLADTGGPRAGEARKRASQIRNQHFLF